MGLDVAGRDVRPAAQSLSFASSKERNQRKDDPAVRVPSLRYGQPAVLAHGVCRITHCALRAPFGQMRQVSSRSMGAATPMPTPCTALLGTARREPAIRAIAALGLERAGATRREGGAERSDGPCGCSPLWLRLWRGGCGVSMGVEAPMLRGLTRRGCSNGAAQQRSEFCGAPRTRTATGLPRSAA